MSATTARLLEEEIDISGMHRRDSRGSLTAADAAAASAAALAEKESLVNDGTDVDLEVWFVDDGLKVGDE